MKNFLLAKIHAGVMPVSYTRRLLLSGSTEAEFARYGV